jgi:type II secretory pathway pseudopilin PulG
MASIIPKRSSRTRRQRPGSRRAITLLELMLALAILVAMAAISAPTINRTWERYRVKLAGDQLRAAFSRAHVQAMRTGQTQVMRFEVGGDQYAVQPWVAGDEMINASAQEAFEQTQPQYQSEAVKPERLPDDVIFELAEAKFDTRATEIEEEALRQRDGQTQWSQPILFYPDGTSSQAKVVVANKRGQAVQVTLRKLTGLTTVSDVSTLEELTAEETP